MMVILQLIRKADLISNFILFGSSMFILICLLLIAFHLFTLMFKR
ncbi:hypothetical protein FB550_101102 [Neobacillus bataviensis]|uniref:Uncharacterized protein n=1 Tax=Neobacillus bataviensis TaxID=220685 RepID=A0A561DXI9_9BACI|nr:hypothetical protein FB550_101102 [Neobacillus bataviensis]